MIPAGIRRPTLYRARQRAGFQVAASGRRRKQIGTYNFAGGCVRIPTACGTFLRRAGAPNTE